MLGVEVDCSCWKTGSIVVKNQELRSKEIEDLATNLSEGGHLSSQENSSALLDAYSLQRLRSWVVWASWL